MNRIEIFSVRICTMDLHSEYLRIDLFSEKGDLKNRDIFCSIQKIYKSNSLGIADFCIDTVVSLLENFGYLDAEYIKSIVHKLEPHREYPFSLLEKL